ncbi:PREDICTED: UTP--glucose-1-phosphate uridylyltransferase 1-like [Camelina sativa]|uniref:UTP--glucose-1-phosphate uridylyltransferase n=1 Tax=Camelina sativa TaxID=90675 RepID=A0ABM0Y5Z0_CAMSA|nr:PREDICTED: UTP--glucose-1-phosphate uridylyltransferase 1-like [Camelina sativa]XP_010501506.1 PREDICTED: UTP--glucose-1-phosphate uridylyltransferase 1-like [Camelina sativa]
MKLSGEAQHGEGSKIQIPKTVPLSELPIVFGDSKIKHLLEQFSMIKMNESWGTTGCATVFVEVQEGVTVLDKITNEIDNLNTDYDSSVPVIFMSSLTADPHTKKILEDDSSNVDFHSVCQIKYPSILADEFVPFHSKDGWYSPGDAFTPLTYP